MDLLSVDACGLSERIAASDISAAEVMRATLARIAAVNGTVNAIVSLRAQEELLAEAEAADRAPRKGWLHGIPMAIKDLADAAGFATSQGSPIFRDHIAQRDDLVVSRLRAAGAIIIGKTNTPEFGLGSHTFNPVHGATRNPYDPSRSAGGSSGGAAAALACGMLAVADGSDMMGSLRNPAAWNNVYGMRPSHGVVSGGLEGDLFLHPLSTSGPMARTPRDLAALLDTMAALDRPRAFGLSVPTTLPQIDAALSPVRAGWLGDWGGALPYEAGILDLCDSALEQMRGLGWRVTDLTAPFDAEDLWRSWTTLRSFAVANSLGALHDNPTLRAQLKTAALWEVQRGGALSGVEIQQASSIRSDWFRRAMALFEDHDILVAPSAQVWPFAVEQVHPATIAGREMDTYHRWMETVIPASLIGLPVVSVPVGFGARGLPMGVQLVGRPGSDGLLLRIAQRWHLATGWPQQRPATV
ncbi:amidase [Sulfitobacter sp. LCG007]